MAAEGPDTYTLVTSMSTRSNRVPNREFASTMGRVMHRPAFVPAPGFAMKLLLGEMADALLLTGQRVLPAKPRANGFAFRFESLKTALTDLLG
jgi:uncharacterized protein